MIVKGLSGWLMDAADSAAGAEVFIWVGKVER